jgi:quinol monooxygenase YgiN
MLALIARMKVQAGKEAEFEQVMGELAAQVRKHESGCKLYNLCKGREAGEYVVLERYESQEALTAHGQSDYFRAAFPRLGGLLDGRVKIETLTEL